MSNTDHNGCLISLMWLIIIGISVSSGIMAWNWIEPDVFFGALIFLFVWAILSRIGHFKAMMIIAIFGGID